MSCWHPILPLYCSTPTSSSGRVVWKMIKAHARTFTVAIGTPNCITAIDYCSKVYYMHCTCKPQMFWLRTYWPLAHIQQLFSRLSSWSKYIIPIRSIGRLLVYKSYMQLSYLDERTCISQIELTIAQGQYHAHTQWQTKLQYGQTVLAHSVTKYLFFTVQQLIISVFFRSVKF